MNPAVKSQFARVVGEYTRWRAVSDHERSDAPAWWWGPAMDARERGDPMPDDWCGVFGLPAGSAMSAASAVLIAAMAPQERLPWPENFPVKPRAPHSPGD